MIATTTIVVLAITAVIGWCYAIEAHQRAKAARVALDRLEADYDALDSIRLAEVARRRRVEAALHGGDPVVWAGLRATERELGRLR
jgi:hypothetical protein